MRKFEVVKGYEDKGIILPTRSTKYSAGYDIRAYIPNNGEVLIKPFESVVLKTGVKVAMEEDEVFQIYVRSSIGIKKHLILSCDVGVVDSDYFGNEKNDGEIFIALTNIGDITRSIKNGERVCQGIFYKYLTTDDDNANGQRIGGIGSTNEKSI